MTSPTPVQRLAPPADERAPAAAPRSHVRADLVGSGALLTLLVLAQLWLLLRG